MGFIKKKDKITAEELGKALYNYMINGYKRWYSELQENVDLLNAEEKVNFEWELIFLKMFGVINICENIIKDNKIHSKILDSFHETFQIKLIEDGYHENLQDFIDVLNQRYTQYRNALSNTDKAGPLFHFGKIAFQNLFPKLDPGIDVVYKLGVLFTGQGLGLRKVIDSVLITN